VISRFKETVRIGHIEIGSGRPALVVAEIGGNHGGDPDLAREMIDAAAASGAGAVKFQTYRTGSFLRRSSEYFDELAAEELSFEDVTGLARHAQQRGILFLTSVFDPESLGLAADLDLPAIKIASCDLDNLPLLEAAAGLDRPIILSTGASEWSEIDEALEFLTSHGVHEVVLLQCTALYPCPDDQVHLRVIPAMAERYGLPIGFSDHSLGVEVPLAAMALGAALLEKHFTIDRTLPGGDNEMSCLPLEMEMLARGAGRIARALGSPDKRPAPAEEDVRRAIRRSVVASVGIRAGQTFSRANLALKRPGGDLPPEAFYRLLGRRAVTDLATDEPVTWEKVR